MMMEAVHTSETSVHFVTTRSTSQKTLNFTKHISNVLCSEYNILLWQNRTNA
jgi:hypothetical protein